MTLKVDKSSTMLEYQYATDVANIPIYKHNLSDKIDDSSLHDKQQFSAERASILSGLLPEPQKIVF